MLASSAESPQLFQIAIFFVSHLVSLVFRRAVAAEQREDSLVVLLPALPLRWHLLHRLMNVVLVDLSPKPAREDGSKDRRQPVIRHVVRTTHCGS